MRTAQFETLIADIVFRANWNLEDEKLKISKESDLITGLLHWIPKSKINKKKKNDIDKPENMGYSYNNISYSIWNNLFSSHLLINQTLHHLLGR